jgi:HEAT repeat protein
MPALSQRLPLLGRIDPGSANAFIGAAMTHAETEELPALFRAAIAMRRAAPLAALLRELHRLSADGPDLVEENRNDIPIAAMDAAIGDALRHADDRVARPIAEVIARLRHPRLARHLPRILGLGPAAVPAAARALLALTVEHVASRDRAADEAGRLDDAVAAAGLGYRTHRAADVVMAVALLSDRPGPRLRAVLGDEEQAVTAALRGVARRADDPLVRSHLLRWLGNDHLQRSARRWFHRLDDVDAFAAVLEDGHLLLAPKRRRALRDAVRPLQCMPSIEVAAALSSRGQPMVPVLASRLDLSGRVRHRLLEEMIALPSPVARLRVLQSLLATTTDVAASVEPFSRDRSGAVARLAAGHLMRGAEPSTLRRLERGAYPGVARRAGVALARLDMDELFVRWSALADTDRRAAARRWLERDRTAFVDRLRALLVDENAGYDARTDALLIARRLRLVPELEPTIVELGADRAPRVVASALAALAYGEGADRLPTLLGGLEHPNERVRANAVEALGRDGSADAVAAIETFVRSPENRLRANAVRSLVRAEPARGVVELRMMLRDPSPLHRISAVWLAARDGAARIRTDLAQVARGDRVPLVRMRAEAALRRLSGPRTVESVGAHG